MAVTVRYFAAARAAAGVDHESVDVNEAATVADVVEVLRTRGPELERVLARCSYLRDGVAVRDISTPLGSAQTIDVLPPFAGG
ncbi:MoaD/ThiS family protein [Mycobacterium sp. PSTR-4-N]|uniref:MoaD/ThiS family protein n=1 Tax=Mycobacterium sp. PSTR-4-N TaxID=2917745 RepID=UPI001F153C8D|nr:MoaD/ThiS family protein [Mycobacterium sp. PSTR-4-N]MCG7593203.1 MoaD/ThiS family protein [Mycobacterium sp. PSTR-4-N]